MSDSRRSVALIGMRGVGKTAVGRELAFLLGGEFVDTDEEITLRAAQTIAGIFASKGERGFRKLERQVIAEVCESPPSVVSVGGGAVMDKQNVAALREACTMVWLTAPVEVLHARISNDPDTEDTRPALENYESDSQTEPIEELRRLFSEREAGYAAAADLIIDAGRLPPPDVARQIYQSLPECKTK